MMGVGFGGVILKAALEGFQTELTAIELSACCGVIITDNTLIFGATGGKPQQSSPFFVQRVEYTTTLS